MAKIKLHSNGLASFTSVPNIFIDKYMTNANGEYIKIYLYLLRCMESGNTSFSIPHLADVFEHTETDILRALHYWEKQELIHLDFDSQQNLSGIQLTNPYDMPNAPQESPALQTQEEAPVPVTYVSREEETPSSAIFDKDNYTAEQVDQFQDNESVQEILFITENYLGRTLNASDVRTILYWYDGLKFSPDLIEYLIETCISNGHTSLRYMEKIALSWAQNHITSVTQAREEHAMHSQSVYGVMKAFGINGRNLIATEIAFVKKWTKDFSFPMDIIEEACHRTITSTGKASFEYADTILTNWHKNHVHTLDDVVKLDTVHKARAAAKPPETAKGITVSGSRFHNCPQRTYNYGELEKKFLKATH